MAKPPIRIKRSAVSGAIPTTAQLALGELAINTADGKVFLKKDDGVESIIEIGAAGGGSPLTVGTYGPLGDIDIVTEVTAIRFNTSSGFSVVEGVNGNEALIALNSTFKTWKIPGQDDLVAEGEDIINITASGGVTLTTSTVGDVKTLNIHSTEGSNGAYTSPVALALYEKSNSGLIGAFDGIETRFQLRDTSGNYVTITNALYAAVSVNGVVQKPNTGTPSSPFEGFYITANATEGYDIVFDTAPVTGSDFFGVLAGTFTATGGTSGITLIDDLSSQFDGLTTAFTLQVGGNNYSPEYINALVISVGGVLQIPNDAYTVSGSTITFSSAPPTGASFYGVDFVIGPSAGFLQIDGGSSSTIFSGSLNTLDGGNA